MDPILPLMLQDFSLKCFGEVIGLPFELLAIVQFQVNIKILNYFLYHY